MSALLSANQRLALEKTSENNSTFKKLKLVREHADASFVALLAEGLATNCYLEHIDLSLNKLEDDGAIALARALEVAGCKLPLEALILCLNGIRVQGMRSLATPLCKFRGMKKLILDGNIIGDEGLMALLSGANNGALSNDRSFPLLSTLSLANCAITEIGGRIIVRHFMETSSLESLNLADNRLRDGGAGLMAFLLLHCKNLKELDLSNNRITDDGCGHLAAALSQNPPLQILRLARNEITDASCPILRHAILWGNRSLQKLYIEHNSISKGGVTKLVSLVGSKKNIPITYVKATISKTRKVFAMVERDVKTPYEVGLYIKQGTERLSTFLNER